jgi:type I restriction enzyme M protein
LKTIINKRCYTGGDLPEHEPGREDTEHFATIVSNADIATNRYNLAVSSYVEREDTSEAVDITALNADIARIVTRQQELREQIDVIVANLEGAS